MKRNRNGRLLLHRETLHRLEPGRLGQALGAGPEKTSATLCTSPSRLNLCSEAPYKCHFTDPTKDEACQPA